MFEMRTTKHTLPLWQLHSKSPFHFWEEYLFRSWGYQIAAVRLQNRAGLLLKYSKHCFVVSEHSNWLSFEGFWSTEGQEGRRGGGSRLKVPTPQFKCLVLCNQCPVDRNHEGQHTTHHSQNWRTFAFCKRAVHECCFRWFYLEGQVVSPKNSVAGDHKWEHIGINVKGATFLSVHISAAHLMEFILVHFASPIDLL